MYILLFYYYYFFNYPGSFGFNEKEQGTVPLHKTQSEMCGKKLSTERRTRKLTTNLTIVNHNASEA